MNNYDELITKTYPIVACEWSHKHLDPFFSETITKFIDEFHDFICDQCRDGYIEEREMARIGESFYIEKKVIIEILIDMCLDEENTLKVWKGIINKNNIYKLEEICSEIDTDLGDITHFEFKDKYLSPPEKLKKKK